MQIAASNIFAFIIGLGFLIFAHEAGHFVVAKLFKVRVLVFSLGFGKRLFGFRRGDTDYRVSVFPLGGYVRMAGDTPDENHPNDPGEFLSKPKWQRFLILLAGPAVNIMIAILFFAGVSMRGTEQAATPPILGEVIAGRPAARAGLQVGDRILAVDGDPINDFDDLRLVVTVHPGTPLRVEYLRNGVHHLTTLVPEREESNFGPQGKVGIRPLVEPVVGKVLPNTPAQRAGLRVGDRILAINGHPITQLDELDAPILASKGGPVTLEIQRGNQILHGVPLGGAKLDDSDPYRGIWPRTIFRKLGPIDALEDSVSENLKMLKFAGEAIGRIARGDGSVKELSGPISIARISGAMFRRGWITFIMLVSMISLQLGVMNLLPIPVLDGGHIFILLIEGVARRDLSLRVKERIQQLGFAALAALMLVVIYNDVVTNFIKTKTGG